MRPVAKVAAGVVVAILAVLPWACGAGTQRLPGVVQCQLDALKVLPEDPLQATPYDVIDIIERVKACKKAAADAGTS